MSYTGSEYLPAALRTETRLCFFRTLLSQRSHTVKGAMVDIHFLLRGVSGVFTVMMGARCMAAGLREHAVLHTTKGAYDPDENSVAEGGFGPRKRGTRCPLHLANAPVTLWTDAAEYANEIYNHSKRPVPGQRVVVEPIILERRSFVGEAESVCCLEKSDQAGTSNSAPW